MNSIVINFNSGRCVDFELEDKSLKKLDKDLTNRFGARFDLAEYGYDGNYTINSQHIETWSFVNDLGDPVKIWKD